VSPTSGVVAEAWALYKAHWRHLLAISFAVYVTIAVVGAVLTALLTWVGAVIAGLISLVGLFLVQGALIKAVEDVRDGRADLSLGETLARASPHLAAIVVAGLLAGIGVFLGLLLLVVPGLVLMTWWFLIIPVIVLEGTSAGASFGRSRELVRGYGWSVFGVIVLTILLLLAFSIVLGIVLTPLANWLQNFISNIVSGTLTAPFIAITWTLLYYRLRDAKAGAVGPPAA
jgi:hypothetical protein